MKLALLGGSLLISSIIVRGRTWKSRSNIQTPQIFPFWLYFPVHQSFSKIRRAVFLCKPFHTLPKQALAYLALKESKTRFSYPTTNNRLKWDFYCHSGRINRKQTQSRRGRFRKIVRCKKHWRVATLRAAQQRHSESRTERTYQACVDLLNVSRCSFHTAIYQKL